MKKEKTLSVLLALLLVLSLTACGGNSGGGSNSAAVPDTPMEYPDADFNGSVDSGAGWNEDEAKPIQTGLPADTKIILSADISLETTEFDAAEQAVRQLVTDAGGWFESRSVYQGGAYRRLHAAVRVPAAEFYTFLDLVGETAHVTNRNEYAEDVSEMYYDSESRLATQQTKLERLHLLLSQAAAMEDIISLETAISETELEIEHLTGSLRKYDSLVGYSTITLSLQEVYRLSGDDAPAVTFGQRLGSAFSLGFTRGIAGLEEFAVSLARNWFNLLLLAIVIAAAVPVLRWWGRKRGRPAKKPPKPPTPPVPPTSDK